MVPLRKRGCKVRLWTFVRLNQFANGERAATAAIRAGRPAHLHREIRKDLFKAQTTGTISKRYEDRNRGELKDLLKRCKDFDAADEPKLEDTHTFTSRNLHPDDRMPQGVPSGGRITAHYTEMSKLLNKYQQILGM